MPEEIRRHVAPRQLHIGSGRDAATFELSPAYVALHRIDAGTSPNGAVLVFTEEGIAVIARDAVEQLRGAGTRCGPVYVNTTGSSLAVPTGRVFLRLAEDRSPQALRTEIERAGFAIAAVPEYAPHAAWLAPKDGDIASALAALPGLRNLPGVAHVEPELLQRRAPR